MYLINSYPIPTTTAAGYGGYTGFTRGNYLPNNATINSIGVYSGTAASIKFKVALRNSAGNYTVTHDEAAYSHGGTGWESKTLGTPYVVPSSGNYVLGAYFSTNITNYSGNAGHQYRAYQLGDQTGSSSGYTEDTNSAPAMRFTLSSISTSTIEKNYDTGTTTNGTAGYTVTDYDMELNGASLTAIGIYSGTALTYKVKLLKKNSATNLDVVVDESFSHGGTGWEHHTLASPYDIPTTGTYVLGMYCASASPQFQSRNRAYYFGDATGSSVTFTADSNATPLLAATISPLSSFQAAWATKHNQLIGAGVF